MRKKFDWLDLLVRIVVYGGIGYVVLVALSPFLLFIFQGPDDGIPGPYGPCQWWVNDCG